MDETKADKNWIQSEFERVSSFSEIKLVQLEVLIILKFKKADKRDLDGKVNRKLFDDTTNDLNKSFDTCMHKHGLLVRIQLHVCI